MSPQRLHPEDLEALGRFISQALAASDEWLTVDEYAARFKVSASTVYAHADELGAVRIGGALRLPSLPPERPRTPSEASPAPRQRRSPSPRVDLLPIGGGR